MSTHKWISLPLSAALLLATLPAPLRATRLKDLVTIEGVRDNLLLGYGLVVGLAGTGDGQQTLFSIQSLSNLLRKMGVNVPPGGFRVNNIAAVMVTATLPPFSTPGSRIDVTVSSIGDADTLQGGTLVLTPLKAADGEVYAVAQGPLSIGGFSAGRGGSSVQVNHPTVGRIPEGALIERAAPSVEPDPAGVRLQLRRPDFVTASHVAAALNRSFPNAVANPSTPPSSRCVCPTPTGCGRSTSSPRSTPSRSRPTAAPRSCSTSAPAR